MLSSIIINLTCLIHCCQPSETQPPAQLSDSQEGVCAFIKHSSPLVLVQTLSTGVSWDSFFISRAFYVAFCLHKSHCLAFMKYFEMPHSQENEQLSLHFSTLEDPILIFPFCMFIFQREKEKGKCLYPRNPEKFSRNRMSYILMK